MVLHWDSRALGLQSYYFPLKCLSGEADGSDLGMPLLFSRKQWSLNSIPKLKRNSISTHCWGQSGGEILNDNYMVPMGISIIIIIVTIFIEHLLWVRHCVNSFHYCQYFQLSWKIDVITLTLQMNNLRLRVVKPTVMQIIEAELRFESNPAHFHRPCS